MCGPFSSTVTLSRRSIRLARDAAVKPAAFPPMMRIFSIGIRKPEARGREARSQKPEARIEAGRQKPVEERRFYSGFWLLASGFSSSGFWLLVLWLLASFS